MPPPPYDHTGIQHCDIPSFSFTNGATRPIRVAYRSHNPTAKKIACIPTCYGGRVNTTLTFTDENGAFSSHHVIVIAMLGNGESSSPSNTPNFPETLDYRDCINAQYRLLTEYLGIRELDAVCGFSMGGQQTYYWAAMYPKFVNHAIVICGSAKTSGHNYAFLEGPKTAMLNSIDYMDGECKAKGIKPLRGLRAFGRGYCAWLTSGAWYRQRQWERLGYKSIEDYVAGIEAAFVEGEADDLLLHARMWQAGDIGTTREDGDYKKALEAIEARVLVMPSRTDQYFAWEDGAGEVDCLRRGELAVIETVWGHVAGGGGNEEDTRWMSGRIGKFLAEG